MKVLKLSNKALELKVKNLEVEKLILKEEKMKMKNEIVLISRPNCIKKLTTFLFWLLIVVFCFYVCK